MFFYVTLPPSYAHSSSNDTCLGRPLFFPSANSSPSCSVNCGLLSQLHAKVPNKNKENLTDEGWGHTNIWMAQKQR